MAAGCLELQVCHQTCRLQFHSINRQLASKTRLLDTPMMVARRTVKVLGDQGWGLLNQFYPIHYFPRFWESSKCQFNMIFIFDKCHRIWAAVAPVKYECSSMNLTSIFAKLKVFKMETLMNGASVASTLACDWLTCSLMRLVHLNRYWGCLQIQWILQCTASCNILRAHVTSGNLMGIPITFMLLTVCGTALKVISLSLGLYNIKLNVRF